jgi:hypothetical protein
MANPFEKYLNGGATASATHAPSAPPSPQDGGNPFSKYLSTAQHEPMPNQHEYYSPPTIEDDEHRAARQWLDAHGDQRPGAVSSMLNKIGQGVTFGWADEAAAGLRSVGDAVKHGGMPGDYYAREKAMQDELMSDASANTGVWGTAGELIGGVAGGAAAGASARALRAIQGAGMPAVLARTAGSVIAPTANSTTGRMAAGALEGGIYGGVSGAGSRDGDRLSGAREGAMIGGAMGAAIPAAIQGAKHAPVTSQLINRVSAHLDPRRFAYDKLAQTAERDGKSIDDVIASVRLAEREGQGGYTFAEASGPSAQAQLAALAKMPSRMSSGTKEFLTERGASAGRRLSGFTGQAFEAPKTHAAYIEDVKASMNAADDINYPAAANNAGPVDLSAARNLIENYRNPSGTPGAPPHGQSAARPSVEEAAQLISGANSSLSGQNFLSVLDAKQQIGDKIGEALTKQRGYEAKQLIDLKKALDGAMEDASPGFLDAQATHEGYQRLMRAADDGAGVGVNDLPEDLMKKFNGLSIGEQEAFRKGFADRLRRGFGGTPGSNKANPLTREYLQEDIQNFAAPGRADRFIRQVGRENEMAQTAGRALGGSPTFEHIQQATDLGKAADLARKVATKDYAALAQDAASWVFGEGGGNTEAMRNHLLDMLTSGKVPAGATLPQGATALLSRLGLGTGGVAQGDLHGLRRAIESSRSTEANMIRNLIAASIPATAVRAIETHDVRKPNGPYSVLYHNQGVPAVVGGSR